jgi:hypothetical protein
MTDTDEKDHLKRLVEKARTDAPHTGASMVDHCRMASPVDVVSRDRTGLGRPKKKPRLMLRNRMIYVVHGEHRQSTGFEALPGMDYRVHPGACRALEAYAQEHVRAMLQPKG